jgi:hypothetical protein
MLFMGTDDDRLGGLWRRFTGVEERIPTEVLQDNVAIFWYGRRQLVVAIEFLVELVRRLYGIEVIGGFELRDPYAGGAVLLNAKELPAFMGGVADLLIARSLEEADLVIEDTAPGSGRLRFEGGGGSGSIALDVLPEHQDEHLRLVREIAGEMKRKHSMDFPGLA